MGWRWEDKSLWEFLAAADGYALANGAKPEPEPMSYEEFQELLGRR